MTQITLNKGGTAEKTVEAESLQIPDLWHIADWLDGEAITKKRPELANQAEKIREAWHIAHDLKRHIIEA
jgi:hypothetical protein